MKEAELRDKILKNPEVIEKNLNILDKEKYIPNELGTRGFIDLYARDERGHHTLIELKRSQPATREAINEILKYVEGVKHNFGANDREIRVIIASTEWKELIVPFSRFVHDSNVSVIGLKLEINEDNIISEKVEPLKIYKGRFIAPWYDVFWYRNKASLDRGINSIEKSCLEKLIKDYVVGVFELTEPSQSEPQVKRHQVLRSMFGGSSEKPLPLYEYIVVLARQIQSEKDYIHILQKDPEKFSELEDILEGMEDEEERKCYLHESVMEIEPIVDSDDYEIGNPAKFRKYFSDSNKQLIEIHRSGMFENNKILTDEQIISDLQGDQGSSGQTLKCQVDISSKSHVHSLKEDIEYTLSENPVWRNQMLSIVQEAEVNYPGAFLDVSLYNPSTGIFTLYFLMTKEDGVCYLPNYVITIKKDEEVLRSYFGLLNGKKVDVVFDDLINNYYDGEVGILTQSITWGARDNRDIDILSDLGLSYESYKIEIQDEDKNLFILKNYRWKKIDFESIDLGLRRYTEENSNIIDSVLSNLGSRDYGFMFSNTPMPMSNHIIIPRIEVESFDLTNILTEFSYLLKNPNIAKASQGNIEISFDGYNEDSRELFEIKEVREFVQEMAKEITCIFFFINLNSRCKSLKMMLLCHAEVERNNSDNTISFNLDTSQARQFMYNQWCGLNELTDQLGMSLEENKRISKDILDDISKL